jgi:hypothetical protein
MADKPASLDTLPEILTAVSETRPPNSLSPMWFWTWGILLLLPVWLPRYWPTEDGLAHLYWIEVFRSLGSADSPFAPFFVRNLTWDRPYQMLQLCLQYGLGSFLEPHLAQKIVVSLAILSWIGAIHFVSRTMCRHITLGAFAALLLIHSSWLYNGFFAFMGAMPLVLVTLGLLARLNTPSSQNKFRLYCIIGIEVLIAYYAHFFVGALILMLGAAWLLFPWHPRYFRRAYLAVALLPTALLAVWYLTRGTLGGGGMIWESPVRVIARFVGLAFFRGFASPTPSFWLALVPFAGLLAFLTVSAIRTESFSQMPQTRRFVFILSGFLLATYFIAPAAVGEASPFHARLHYGALALLLPILPARLSGRVARLVTAVISALLTWQVVTFSARGLRLSQNYATLLEQADVLPSGALITSSLLYGNARYEGSFIHVLATVPEDIAFRRQAVLLNSFFTDRPYYWVRPRPGPVPHPAFRIDLERDRQRALVLLIEKAP